MDIGAVLVVKNEVYNSVGKVEKAFGRIDYILTHSLQALKKAIPPDVSRIWPTKLFATSCPAKKPKNGV